MTMPHPAPRSTRAGRLGRLLGCTVALAALAPSARADQPAPQPIAPAEDRAAAAAQAGVDAYTVGDYETAATAFGEAYRLDPQPLYLFNQAQSHRLGGGCAAARDAYRLYLERVPEAANRAEIEAWIAEQERCVADLARVRPDPPPTEPTPVATTPPPRTDGGRTRRIVGASLVGAGVVGLALGGWSATRIGAAEDAIAELYAQPTWGVDQDAQLSRLTADGERWQTRAWLGLGLGGAAVIAGVVTYVWGRSASAEDRTVTVQPVDGGVALAAAGRF